MNEQPKDTPEREPDSRQGSEVDQGRRRLGAGLGASGTAILLSVPSRSAVAGWGSCTGSEIASGNLSRTASANPCGCSPGFWWNRNGKRVWTSAPSLYTVFPRTAKFNLVFGVPFYSDPNVELKDVGPGTSNPNAYNANNNTGMHAVAALLNAQYYGSRYPVVGLQTASAVISAFRSACGPFPGNRKAQLVDFVNTVDIYDRTPDLWCNGDPEGRA